MYRFVPVYSSFTIDEFRVLFKRTPLDGRKKWGSRRTRLVLRPYAGTDTLTFLQ